MVKYRKRADLDLVIIPGVGRVVAGQTLEGPEFKRFCPSLLERVPELEPKAVEQKADSSSAKAPRRPPCSSRTTKPVLSEKAPEPPPVASQAPEPGSEPEVKPGAPPEPETVPGSEPEVEPEPDSELRLGTEPPGSEVVSVAEAVSVSERVSVEVGTVEVGTVEVGTVEEETAEFSPAKMDKRAAIRRRRRKL